MLSNSKVKFPQVTMIKSSYYEIARSRLHVSNFSKVSGRQAITIQGPYVGNFNPKPNIITGALFA